MNTVCYPSVPKGWLKTRIFTFGVAFHFFVAGNCRHFKLNMWVEHSKSQPTDDKTSLKWAWPRHVTHFKLLVPLRYLWNGNISKTVRDSFIVYINLNRKSYALYRMVADDLGCSLNTLNHLNFYILHCLMHLHNWRSQRL